MFWGKGSIDNQVAQKQNSVVFISIDIVDDCLYVLWVEVLDRQVDDLVELLIFLFLELCQGLIS